jgi:cobalt-zinc-cadmium efflux system membrane fusion protein
MNRIGSVILNLLGFAVITAGVIFYFSTVQTPSAIEAEHGHAHGHGGHTELGTIQTASFTSAAVSPENRDPNRLWCREHGVYEDECFICHPELAQKKTAQEQQRRDPNRLWCSEHGVYEDECTICHPEIAQPKAKTGHEHHEHGEGVSEHDVHNHAHDDHSSGHVMVGGELFCNEHRVLERECAICQPELAAQLKPGESMKVRFPSREAIVKANVQTTAPGVGNIRDEVSFPAQITFDQNHYAHISPLADGVVLKVYVEVGDKVKQGAVLVELSSAQIATAKSEYISALAQEKLKQEIYQREKDLFAKKISPEQDYQQAEAEYQVAGILTQNALQNLKNFGLSDAEIQQVKKSRSNTSTFQVRAPFAGTLVEKHAVLGETVKAGEPIFELADLSTLWLELSIPEQNLSSVQVGDLVQATFDAYPGLLVEGKLTWIASSIDPASRMLKARAVIPNQEGKLKKGLFGRVQVVNVKNEEYPVVPLQAVQLFEGKPYVFVKEEDDLFELRQVALGAKNEQVVEVVQGVFLEDQIVSTGSFTLKSEFLKSRFGAGCTDH